LKSREATTVPGGEIIGLREIYGRTKRRECAFRWARIPSRAV